MRVAQKRLGWQHWMILAADKDEILAEYALGSVPNQLYVSRYQLHLPDREQLQRKVRYLLDQMKSKRRGWL